MCGKSADSRVHLHQVWTSQDLQDINEPRFFDTFHHKYTSSDVPIYSFSVHVYIIKDKSVSMLFSI